MGYRIVEIEGIGPSYAKKLAKAKISNTNGLLKHCADRKGRKAISKTTGVSEKQLLKWANMADLMRVDGIGRQYSELLEAAGVDTIKELRTRRVDNLAETMTKVNAKKRLCRATPSEKLVKKWISSAKRMKPTISH